MVEKAKLRGKQRPFYSEPRRRDLGVCAQKRAECDESAQLSRIDYL